MFSEGASADLVGLLWCHCSRTRLTSRGGWPPTRRHLRFTRCQLLHCLRRPRRTSETRSLDLVSKEIVEIDNFIVVGPNRRGCCGLARPLWVLAAKAAAACSSSSTPRRKYAGPPRARPSSKRRPCFFPYLTLLPPLPPKSPWPWQLVRPWSWSWQHLTVPSTRPSWPGCSRRPFHAAQKPPPPSGSSAPGAPRSSRPSLRPLFGARRHRYARPTGMQWRASP